MRIPNAHYLIIDLEATCCDKGGVPTPEMETIEIGAVMMNARTFEIRSEFQTFIRPVRHPQLTAFCTNLTHITQKEVDTAPLFPEAMDALTQWMRPFEDALFCSWGKYDRFQFLQDCAFHGVVYPFGEGHFNLKAQFSKALTTNLKHKRHGMRRALDLLGMQVEGAHHRGIDDARNIARIVQRVCMGAT